MSRSDGIAIVFCVLLSFGIGLFFGWAYGQADVGISCDRTGTFTLRHPLLLPKEFKCEARKP